MEDHPLLLSLLFSSFPSIRHARKNRHSVSKNLYEISKKKEGKKNKEEKEKQKAIPPPLWSEAAARERRPRHGQFQDSFNTLFLPLRPSLTPAAGSDYIDTPLLLGQVTKSQSGSKGRWTFRRGRRRRRPLIPVYNRLLTVGEINTVINNIR